MFGRPCTATSGRQNNQGIRPARGCWTAHDLSQVMRQRPPGKTRATAPETILPSASGLPHAALRPVQTLAISGRTLPDIWHQLRRKRGPCLVLMGEEEERELLREIVPDRDPEKIDVAQRMLALSWRCDSCGYVTNSKVPIKIPVPCVQCGGVAFRMVNEE
jgi:hypothetical protein